MYDVDIILDKSDEREVLIDLSIEFEVRGTELYFKCPNPEHVTDKKTVSISTDGNTKGLFNCWSCPCKGNLVQLVQIVTGANFQESAQWLSDKVGVSKLGGTERLMYDLKQVKGRKNDASTSLPVFDLPKSYAISSESDADAGCVSRYLRKRGISEDVEWAYRVGHSFYEGIGWAITIPITLDSRIRSIYYGEPVDGGSKRYPKGAPQGRLLFGYDEARSDTTGYVIVVESILDTLRLVGMGLNSVSCFTNMISDEQLKMLRAFDEIAVFPDLDSPRGWDLVTRMVQELGKGVTLMLPPIGKDPGDCTDDEILKAATDKETYGEWEVRQYCAAKLTLHPALKSVDKN